MSGAAEELRALHEIERVKLSYFRLVDEKRWTEVRALFADGARIDAVSGEPGDPDEFVHSLTCLAPAAVKTVHMPAPPELKLTAPDRATGRWLTWFSTEVPGEDGKPEVAEGLRRYEDEYARGDDGVWRIVEMRISPAPSLRIEGR